MDLDRHNKIKAEKLEHLKLQINAQKERQKELEQVSERIGTEREKSQARKLKVAYEEMLQFEVERVREKQKHQKVREQAK